MEKIKEYFSIKRIAILAVAAIALYMSNRFLDTTFTLVFAAFVIADTAGDPKDGSSSKDSSFGQETDFNL